MVKIVKTGPAFSQVLRPNELTERLQAIEKDATFEFSVDKLNQLTSLVQAILAKSDYPFDSVLFTTRYAVLRDEALNSDKPQPELWKKYNQMLGACLDYLMTPPSDQPSLILPTAISLVEAMGNDLTNAQCFGGAYDRLSQCFQNNIAETINEGIELLRVSIVQSAAYKACRAFYQEHAYMTGNEVHSYNWFFTCAASWYGINPINKEARFKGDFKDTEIEDVLKKAFAEQYTLFTLFNQINTDIDQRLAMMGDDFAKKRDYLATYLSLYRLDFMPGNSAQCNKGIIYLSAAKKDLNKINYHVLNPINQMRGGTLGLSILKSKSIQKIVGAPEVYLEQIVSFTTSQSDTTIYKGLCDQLWHDDFTFNQAFIRSCVVEHLFANHYLEFNSPEEATFLRVLLNPSVNEQALLHSTEAYLRDPARFLQTFSNLTIWAQALALIKQHTPAVQQLIAQFLIDNQHYAYLQAYYEMIPEGYNTTPPPEAYFSIKDKNGCTPIMRAFFYKSILTNDYLSTIAGLEETKQHAILDEARSTGGSTPMMFAAQNGTIEQVEMMWALITASGIAEVKLLNDKGLMNKGLLHWAGENQPIVTQFILARLLEAKQAGQIDLTTQLTAQDINGKTPLLSAGCSKYTGGMISMIQFIEQHAPSLLGTALRQRDNASCNLFASAFYYKTATEIKQCLELFKRYFIDQSEFTAFLVEQPNGFYGAFAMLLINHVLSTDEFFALVNKQTFEKFLITFVFDAIDNTWYTPLMRYGVLYGSEDCFLGCLSLLEKCGKATQQSALFNPMAGSLRTPLQVIFLNASAKHVGPLCQFIKKAYTPAMKVILTQTDEDGNNLLMYACQNKDSAVVLHVLELMRDLDLVVIEKILMQVSQPTPQTALMMCEKNEAVTAHILAFIAEKKLPKTTSILMNDTIVEKPIFKRHFEQGNALALEIFNFLLNQDDFNSVNIENYLDFAQDTVLKVSENKPTKQNQLYDLYCQLVASAFIKKEKWVVSKHLFLNPLEDKITDKPLLIRIYEKIPESEARRRYEQEVLYGNKKRLLEAYNDKTLTDEDIVRILTQKYPPFALSFDDYSQGKSMFNLLQTILPTSKAQILQSEMEHAVKQVPIPLDVIKNILAEDPALVSVLIDELTKIQPNHLIVALKQMSSEQKQNDVDIYTTIRLWIMLHLPVSSLSLADKKVIVDAYKSDPNRPLKNRFEVAYMQWLAFNEAISALSKENISPELQASCEGLSSSFNNYFKKILLSKIQPDVDRRVQEEVTPDILQHLQDTIEDMRQRDIAETSRGRKILDVLVQSFLFLTVVGALIKWYCRYDSKKAYFGLFDRVVKSNAGQALEALQQTLNTMSKT